MREGLKDELLEDEREDDLEDGEEKRERISLDALRRILSSGVSNVLLSEDGLRSALSEMRLPKEAMTYLIHQTEKTRQEFYRAMLDEFRTFWRTMDIPGELKDALTGIKLEVKAEIRFVEDTVEVKTKSEKTETAAPAEKKKRSVRRKKKEETDDS
ncbi:hypothetical protein KAI87_05815 [Myxococcota bacterium]|nr:hypothetical protein [Myxococcota bacterium]